MRLYRPPLVIHLQADQPLGGEIPRPKFDLGGIVATPGALAEIPDVEIQVALYRHNTGDWGDLDPEDRQENEKALVEGHRLFSVYKSRAGVKFYIITEHDRSVTTVLLPQEY